MALSSSLSLSSDSSGNFHAFHDGGGSPFADPFRVPPAFTLESSCSCAAILRHSFLVRVAAFCSWRHRGHGDDVHRALRVPMSATSVRDCASFSPFQYRRTAAALVSAAYGPRAAPCAGSAAAPRSGTSQTSLCPFQTSVASTVHCRAWYPAHKWTRERGIALSTFCTISGSRADRGQFSD